MTVRKAAIDTRAKIRPAGPLWIALLALGVAALGCGADAVRIGQPWFAVLWVAAGGIGVALGLTLRVLGFDLTPEFLVVRMVRARRVSWREVQAPPTRPPNTIQGAGVLLRELTAAGVASLLDEQSIRDGWATDYPFEGSRAAARGFLGRSAGQQHDAAGFGMYQIVRLADGLVIGDIGFHTPPQDGSVEVGFGLAPSARGAGHASEALGLLVGWAARQAGVREIVARTLTDNAPSKGVLARAGFTEIGTDGNFIRYSWVPR